MKSRAYYALMAICLNCSAVYPIASSGNERLCVKCKDEALAWPMKLEY